MEKTPARKKILVWLLTAAVVMAFMPLLPSSGQAVYAAAKADAPESFYGKAVNSTSITLKWSPVKNVKKYAVYQGKKQIGTTSKTSYTAKKLKKNKVYTFKVKAVKGTASYSIKLTTGKSKQKNVSKVALNKKSLKLQVKDSAQLKAALTPSKGTVSKKIVWSSSDKKVASVSQKGLVTAKSAGKATIYARSHSGVQAKCSVTVTAPSAAAVTAKCYNGNFVGKAEADTGILSFKGIPYAKQPTGDLRWKAPQPVSASSKTMAADKFGPTAVQSYWHSEPASYNNERGIGEDCLTLNVWTKDLTTKNKPIMFYIHGGGYGWGGTSDPLYNGQYIVKEHSDVIVISCNYRLGLLGFADFTNVPGGEEYSDSGYLGVLDLIQGLKWVKQNAAAFGGDPDNITIFGESAGGGLVCNLLVVDEAKGLFNRAIAQSGGQNFTYDKARMDENQQVETLMALTGAENMADLVAIPEKELIQYYTTPDEEGNTLCDDYPMPLRGEGSIIPEDPYQAILNGASKDVDVLIGTNADEWRYWLGETWSDKPLATLTPEEFEYSKKFYEAAYCDTHCDAAKQVLGEAKVAEFMALLDPDLEELWKKTELANEIGYRLPAIASAFNHASAGGNTYMYYFGKKATNFDFIGACHASELAYVFHNQKETIFSGEVDMGLADKMCAAWVNFAKTGDPSTDQAKWEPYKTTDRNTMMINNDCTMTMQSDPKSEQRKIVEPLMPYYIP